MAKDGDHGTLAKPNLPTSPEPLSLAASPRSRRDDPDPIRSRFGGHGDGGSSPKRRCSSGPLAPPASRIPAPETWRRGCGMKAQAAEGGAPYFRDILSDIFACERGAMAKPVLFAIDDDTEVLRAVDRDLRRQYGEQYRVMRASSGPSALEAVEQLQVRKTPD